MSKVLTFSRQFPAYHPNKGEPTYFVEKIYESIYPNGFDNHFDFFLEKLNHQLKPSEFSIFFDSINTEKVILPKNHTIRSGNRWKAGDKFSPRVWSGKPYNSKMIIIAPDIEVKKVWSFEIKEGLFFIDSNLYAYDTSTELLNKLAKNDGLSQFELMDWFKYPKDFSGQIICWNDKIEY